MLYYYLDGLDKKGPYTIDELKVRDISPETMVIADGMKNWTAIKDLPELSDKIFTRKIDEPILASSVPEMVDNKPTLTTIETTPKQKKIIIPAVLFLILGIVIAISASYFIVKDQQENDLL